MPSQRETLHNGNRAQNKFLSNRQKTRTNHRTSMLELALYTEHWNVLAIYNKTCVFHLQWSFSDLKFKVKCLVDPSSHLNLFWLQREGFATVPIKHVVSMCWRGKLLESPCCKLLLWDFAFLYKVSQACVNQSHEWGKTFVGVFIPVYLWFSKRHQVQSIPWGKGHSHGNSLISIWQKPE